MVSFRTFIHNGNIAIPATEDLPEGTEVLVQVTPLDEPMGLRQCDWDDTPEGIADWLNWLDTLEPLIFTEQERVRLEADRQAQQQLEHEMFCNHADKLAGEWK